MRDCFPRRWPGVKCWWRRYVFDCGTVMADVTDRSPILLHSTTMSSAPPSIMFVTLPSYPTTIPFRPTHAWRFSTRLVTRTVGRRCCSRVVRHSAFITWVSSRRSWRIISCRGSLEGLRRGPLSVPWWGRVRMRSARTICLRREVPMHRVTRGSCDSTSSVPCQRRNHRKKSHVLERADFVRCTTTLLEPFTMPSEPYRDSCRFQFVT